MKPLTVAQMKNVEKNAVVQGVSYIQLMENAGTESARKIVQKYHIINKNIVILCGSGNNGGDGLVIGRRLYERGANVTVVLCKGLPGTPESAHMYKQLQGSGVEVMDTEHALPIILFKIKEADFIVDTIFGTGFHGRMIGTEATLVERANDSKATRIAIDIPSGINGDTGAVEGVYFHADSTMVLAAHKLAHVLETSRPLCGEQELIDIGIPAEAFDGLDLECVQTTYAMAKHLLPKRAPYSNKGDYGKLLVVAGSVGMGGAALMCTKAALRCGCGLTTLATSKTVAQGCFADIMEAMTLSLIENPDGSISDKSLGILQERMEQATVTVMGCGMGQNEEVQKLIKVLVRCASKPLVLDADGINAVAADINIVKTARCPLILTPHPGEMARLTGLSIEEIQRKREKTAYDFATQNGVYVVLKGHDTIIATPEGKLYQNTTGNAGMAKGGSGDVLAGMIGSFAAQGMSLDYALILAVYVHGLAGDRCAERYSQYGVLARDLIAEIPLLLREMQADESELL